MCEVKSQFSVMWWLLGSMFLPISVPYLIMKMLDIIRERQNRDCLSGKVVVITGASSGLGESLAHTFYIAGCKVVLASRRQDELERVRKDLLELHSVRIGTRSKHLKFYIFSFVQPKTTHPPVIVALDLSDLNSLPAKVDEILAIFGHIDILINNGGISVRADVVTTSMDVDIKVMLVNYFGSVAMTKGESSKSSI
jgi:dehydrogenase/reductase SDR family member 7B